MKYFQLSAYQSIKVNYRSHILYELSLTLVCYDACIAALLICFCCQIIISQSHCLKIMEINNTALNESDKYKSFAFYRYQLNRYEISISIELSLSRKLTFY